MGNCGSSAGGGSAPSQADEREAACSGGESERILSPHRHMATGVCASGRVGEWISCDDSGTIALVRWAAGGGSERWVGHPKSVTRLASAAWLNGVVSASRDTSIRVWHRGSPSAPAAKLDGHDLTVSALAISDSHCGRVVSGSRDSTVRLWDASIASCVSSVYIARNVVTCAAWGGEGSQFVWQGSEDLRLRLWDIRAMAKPSVTLEGYTCFPMCISSYEQKCVTGSNGFSGGGDGGGCELRIWDLRNHRQEALLTAHTHAVTGVALLPGQMIASAARDGTLHLWKASGADWRVVDTRHLGSGATALAPARHDELEARFYATTADGAVRAFAAGDSGLRQVCIAASSA